MVRLCRIITGRRIDRCGGADIEQSLKTIRPLIDRSCADCHAGEKVRGDFNLTSRETLLKGGQSGDPAVVPGRSSDSHLLRYVSDQVEDLEMPPLNHREKYPALSADEITRMRTWIDAGAVWEK